jgi:hypothetical protein
VGVLDEAYSECREVTDGELRVVVIVLAIATVAIGAAFLALVLGIV